MWENENVMGVRDTEIAPLLSGPFTAHTAPALDLIRRKHEFRPRARVETDPSFRQVIPYIVVRHADRYFLTRRTSLQDETRLHNKYSLGIGGHVNDGDAAPGVDPLMAGLQRELREELRIDTAYALEAAGVINDLSNDVSRVHLGLVHVLTLEHPRCELAEEGMAVATWASQHDIEGVYASLETWSQIVFDHLIAKTKAPRSTGAAGPGSR